MVVYYRFSGLLAVVRPRALRAVHARHARRLRRGAHAAGLAGFVLSIGMAVDANVLIFERIREELDRGKTVRTAIDEGFSHALSAIVDTHVTTILTAAVLYQFGTGPVQGFAVALLAGLVAVACSRRSSSSARFFLLWLNRSRGAQTAEHLNAAHPSQHELSTSSAVAHRRSALTVAFIARGRGRARHPHGGFNYSIEFTGGTLMQLEFTQPPNVGADPLDARRSGLPGRRDPAVRQHARVHRSRAGVSDASRAGTAANSVATHDRGGARASPASARTSARRAHGDRRAARRRRAEAQRGHRDRSSRSLVTLIYLAFRFEWRFGVAAVLATAHDIVATLAFMKCMNLEVSLTVVGGVLTVIGYSLNDTIIIFDRVRENLQEGATGAAATTCSTARSTRRCRARS